MCDGGFMRDRSISFYSHDGSVVVICLWLRQRFIFMLPNLLGGSNPFTALRRVLPSARCLVSPLRSASFRPFPFFLRRRFAPRRTIMNVLNHPAALCITLRVDYVSFPTLVPKLHVPQLVSCPLRPARPD